VSGHPAYEVVPQRLSTANPKVCVLVSPYPHLLPLTSRLFLAHAAGSPKVDKPALPPGGQHENLSGKTISGHQIN
jgi:hypothetical protein